MNGPIRHGTARRLARRLGLTRNPLRRGSDRLASAVRLTSYQAAGDAVFAGLAVLCGAALLLVAAATTIDAVLNRRRTAAWERGWARVEPRWTRHFRHH